MLMITSDAESPAGFISCGNLVNENGFTHVCRNLDCYVLIFVQKGCLYIRQDEKNYEVKENEFILLFPQYDSLWIQAKFRLFILLLGAFQLPPSPLKHGTLFFH